MKNFSKYSKRGLPGGPNEIIEYMTGSISTDGFKFDSEDVDNDFNIIPSGDITMEDVMFPVFGIDNLGNSQMMFPEENYEFPGDMVFELPMAQKGGGFYGELFDAVEPEEPEDPNRVFQNSEAKDFILNYINSPKYLERLQSSGYNSAEDERNLRASQVADTGYMVQRETPGLIQQLIKMYRDEPYTTHGSMYSAPYDVIIYDSNDAKKYGYDDASSIIAHEYGHAELQNFEPNRESGLRLNQSDINELVSRLQTYEGQTYHDLKPDENKSDLNALRFELFQQGLYDAGTEDIDEEILRKADSSFIKDRLLKNYSEDDLIWLLNNIAMDDSQEAGLPMAQKGLEKYQTLGSNEPQLKTSTGYVFPYERYGSKAETQFGEYQPLEVADNFTVNVAGTQVDMPIDRDEFGNVDYTTQYNELPPVVIKPKGSFVQYRIPTNRALLNKNKEYQDQQLYVEDDSTQSQRDRLSNFIANNPNLTDRQKRIAQNKIARGRYLQYDKILGGADAWTDTEQSGVGAGQDLGEQERTYDPNYYSSIADFRETIGKPFAAGLAMTPLIIAGGPAAINAGRAILGGISTALNTPLISSAPYVTAGNALNTYFGGDFLLNRAPKIPGLIADEEYGQAAKEGFFGGLDILGLGAVGKSKRAYDLSRNLLNTADDIEDIVRTTDNYFPGYNQTYNRNELKKNLNEIFQNKSATGNAADLKTKVDIGSNDPLALANQDYFRQQGITNINTIKGAEDLARYQQTPDYAAINKGIGNYLETGEISSDLAQFLRRNRDINLQSLTSKSTKPLTGSRVGADEFTLVKDGDQVISKRLSELNEGDVILDIKPTSFSDINAPGYRTYGSNYQGPVTQITNVPAGSSFSVPGVQANQGMARVKDIGDSEILLPVGGVRKYLGLDDQGRYMFDFLGDYNRNFEVGGDKLLPTNNSMLSTESGKRLIKDDRYRDVRKKLGGSVMKRLAKILDEN